MGISGGEQGARNGPSLMLGCAPEAYKQLEPILSKCAAKVSTWLKPNLTIHYCVATQVSETMCSTHRV